MILLIGVPIIIIVILLIISFIGNKSIHSNHDVDKEKENTMKFKKLNELEQDLKKKGYDDKEIKKRRNYASNHYDSSYSSGFSPAILAFLLSSSFDPSNDNPDNDINYHGDDHSMSYDSHSHDASHDHSSDSFNNYDSFNDTSSYTDSGSSFSDGGSFGGDGGGSF